ncbi:MAG: prolyl oligopeptidase family serine peptidase [Steroidobacteraceae bacterium]|jgi:prolyl oligopeptidase
MTKPTLAIAALKALPILIAFDCLAIPTAFADPATIPQPLIYPTAPRGNQVDDYHGTKVPDPYRWMEDVDSAPTRTWVEAQAKLTSDYLAAIPGRERILERLKQIWNFERWGAPEKHGGVWFYSHNDGLQNQSVLFATEDPGKPAHVMLDPNGMSNDGTVAFKGAGYSDDGKWMAYGLSEAGSDWETWHVRDVASGKDLPDELRWAKFTTASWRKDGSGFYYAGYTPTAAGQSLKAQNQFQTVFFHKLGTAEAQDAKIYTRTDEPDWYVGAQVTDDGRYLIITAAHGTDVKNALLVADLAADAIVKPVIAEPHASYAFVGNIGSTLYVLTDDDAPHYRVIAIDLKQPGREHWRSVVAESGDTLDVASMVGHQIIAQYLHDAHSVVKRFSTTGKPLEDVGLPGLGTASGFTGRIDDAVTFYSYADYTTPASIYRLDLKTGRTALWRAPVLNGFKPAYYETMQVFYTSKDGTRVPIFVTARRGLSLDGTHPTILYGYGGFSDSLHPTFSPAIASWLELGGVYAVANLRGGGEYGRAWHEAGMKTHKQNVFDDFIAAAEYLIANRWTSRERLAINGASNGGLLIGAVEEQRPDLFAAAVAQVGVMDMLRFREFTVGKGWEADYGSVDNREEFEALRAYSPLHNVKDGVAYPATLILTGDHDDRVFPAHSFKFAAAMQHADPRGKPILIRIDLRAGHGMGKPVSKRMEETADVYSFVLEAMGLAK